MPVMIFHHAVDKTTFLSMRNKIDAIVSHIFCILTYSDSQKHESSCLLSYYFWCISPEPFQQHKIFLPLLGSIFEYLSDKQGIFRIGAQIHLIFRKTLIFQKKKSAIEKNPPF